MSARGLILIGDADPAFCRLYGTALQSNGFETDVAFDGRDALAKAFALQPAAIVVSTPLTFIDGHELCRLLRGDSRTEEIRVVFVTETMEQSDLERASDAGADAVLARPGALEALPDAVRRALTSVRRRQTSAKRRTAPASTAHRSMVRSHERFATKRPPIAPPTLRCPSCASTLVYDHSHVGGVSAHYGEQWDYFTCAACGAFQYRQRTRILRRAASS